MRFLLLFFFCCFKTFGQQQYCTSDFGYTNDVVKVEESLYKFNNDSKQFELENQYITEIENSYFRKQILVSFFGDQKVIGEYRYYYDSDNSLQKIVYEPVDGKFGYPMKFEFKYKKEKVTELFIEGLSTTFYEYDVSGNLIKETQKDLENGVIKTISYQDYKDKKTFVKLKKEGNETAADFTKEFYENGLLKRREFVSNEFKSETIYTYDAFNNLLSEVYDDQSRIDFGYELDAKNNRNKIAKLSRAMQEDNSFTFVKITYKDGLTSGGTELDLNFVKKYDIAFRTKDSLFQVYRKIKYPKKKYLNILKGEDNDIEILDVFENDYVKVISSLKTTDRKSLIVYNEIDETTHFLKDFYTENFPKHVWNETKEITSKTGLFWIKNDAYQITFYRDGKYLESSNFSIQDDENPNHLVVRLNDGVLFQIKNINSSEVGILYPLLKK